MMFQCFWFCIFVSFWTWVCWKTISMCVFVSFSALESPSTSFQLPYTLRGPSYRRRSKTWWNIHPTIFQGNRHHLCKSLVTCVFYSGTAFNSSFLFLYFWHWPILWLQYTWCDHAGREIKNCSLTCLCSCYLALWSVKSQSLSFQKDYQLQRGVSGIYQWRPLQCPQADKDLSPAVTLISPVSHFSLF